MGQNSNNFNLKNNEGPFLLFWGLAILKTIKYSNARLSL